MTLKLNLVEGYQPVAPSDTAVPGPEGSKVAVSIFIMSYKVGIVPGSTPGWIDTGWACGGIEVLNGIVVGGAPIFRKFYGQRAKDLQKTYKLVNLSKWRKNNERFASSD